MQCLIAAFAIAVVVATVSCQEDKYTGKYDDVDVEAILGNERLLGKYFECLLGDDDAACTADGKELKKNIPDALTNQCSKCSDKQKETVEKVAKFLIKNKEDMWKQLETKFDPEGVYRKQYDAELQKIKQ